MLVKIFIFKWGPEKGLLTKRKDKMWTQTSTNTLERKWPVRQCALFHVQICQENKPPPFHLSWTEPVSLWSSTCFIYLDLLHRALDFRSWVKTKTHSLIIQCLLNGTWLKWTVQNESAWCTVVSFITYVVPEIFIWVAQYRSQIGYFLQLGSWARLVVTALKYKFVTFILRSWQFVFYPHGAIVDTLLTG